MFIFYVVVCMFCSVVWAKLARIIENYKSFRNRLIQKKDISLFDISLSDSMCLFCSISSATP